MPTSTVLGHPLMATAEKCWMFNSEQRMAMKMSTLCVLPKKQEMNTKFEAICKTKQWLEDRAAGMLNVSYESAACGAFLVISFPNCQQPLQRLADNLGPNNQAVLASVWHGTSLWAAWHIVAGCFLIGNYGHTKQSGRRVNGIWCLDTYDRAIGRAATSNRSNLLDAVVSQRPRGSFDAWSTPVGIQFLVHTDELSTCRGTEAGVCCITHMDFRQLHVAGTRANVQHRILCIKFNVKTYELYRDVLADEQVRASIRSGEFVMCSGRRCYPSMAEPAVADALVCPNRNPCGKVIRFDDRWHNAWHKTRSGRYLCAECLQNSAHP